MSPIDIVERISMILDFSKQKMKVHLSYPLLLIQFLEECRKDESILMSYITFALLIVNHANKRRRFHLCSSTIRIISS